MDEDGFKASMEVQREKKPVAAREVTNYMGADVTVYESIDRNVTSEFVGYEHLTWESDVTVLTTETEVRTHYLKESTVRSLFRRPVLCDKRRSGRRIQDISVLQKVNLK